MSLSMVRGPLGSDPAGHFSAPMPEGGVVYVEPHPRRIQALVGDRTVIDTEHALMVHRPGRTLAYAFPADEVGDLPTEPAPESPGYVLVPWDAVDTWVEEGRRLVHYPPNPYHRVDCRPTQRRLRVDGRRHHARRHRRHRHPVRDVAPARSSTSTRPTCAPTCCARTRRPPATATTRAWPPTGRRSSATR